ncbi:jg21612 [Pararge aegeria aegeria]|uniref:Jg21612 protein n=1 Tax=Pararge aegeria aegeria TaxID=348720 RepID=A0A8S4QRR3_9NEOP|nr:jg21612 [Pararge aegeria aegeria]
MGRAHSSENRWTLGLKVLECRPSTGKRSVAWPPTRWTDDIRRVAGSRWGPLEASGPGPCIVELPTKDLCPAVDVDWLSDYDDDMS